MLVRLLIAWALLAAPATAALAARASFLDGTYVMSVEACDKLKALARGATPSITTVPWSVDRKGITYWEGGCGFSRVTEVRKGSEWRIKADCEEGPNQSTEVYTWVKIEDGVYDVTVKGDTKPVRYTRCDVKKKRN